MSLGRNPARERYQEAKRRGIDMESERTPRPVPHWTSVQRTIKQTDEDWVLYDKENGHAFIQVHDPDTFVFELSEVR